MSRTASLPEHAVLAQADPPPVEVLRPHGASDLLLVVDHAGRAVPAALGRLGLPEAEFDRHIAWDIGAMGVGGHLSALLDATLVAQRYSRLVIDCNRAPGHPTSIAPHSDGTDIPGNAGLGQPDRDAREAAIFRPYQDAIASVLDARTAAGGSPVLVAVHSFTPEMAGHVRPWHVGLLTNHDPRLGRGLMALLQREGDLVVGDNEPYSLSDLDDYTVPVHGEQRGLLHVELEIRQDLIATEAGQRAWGQRLARLLPVAVAACRAPGAAAPPPPRSARRGMPDPRRQPGGAGPLPPGTPD